MKTLYIATFMTSGDEPFIHSFLSDSPEEAGAHAEFLMKYHKFWDYSVSEAKSSPPSEQEAYPYHENVTQLSEHTRK